jgi:DNA-binding XRE family transcriptional regulator
MDTFGMRLMLARAYAGHISIRDAADLCGLGRGAWTNWEKEAKPSDKWETCEIISEKLGVDFEWLFHGGPLTPEPRRRRDRHGRGEGGQPGGRAVTSAYPGLAVRPSHGPLITGQKPGIHRPNGGRPGTPPPAELNRPHILARP